MIDRTARRVLSSTSGVVAPADRHFRRPDVPPGRRRRGQRLLLAGRLAAAALVVSAVAFWAGQAVLQSGLLDVNRIVVRGNARLSAADVEALVADLRGEHILDVDLEAYQRRVLESPWVASVTLWRLLPSTVEVSIVERVPVIVARLGDTLYLLDRAGVVVDEFGPDYRDLNLPIVDGVLSERAGGTPGADAERLRLALRLVAALESRPDLERRVSQVDVSNRYDAVVLLDDEAVLLHLGDAEFDARLDRYLELGPTLAETFEAIDYVDLRFDRLFVRAEGRRTAEPAGRRP